MATVSNDQIEEIEARLSDLQSEVDSYADEVAEKDIMIAALLAEVQRLRARID